MYASNLPRAQEIAKAVPLVHTAGKRVPFPTLLSAHGNIPTSDELPGYHSDSTLEAEEALELGGCAYFYAGRACSDFGDVVLAFALDQEPPYHGSATPFDTGGLLHGFIQSNLSRDHATLRAFTKDSTSQWRGWRETFAPYLAAYFNPLLAYWEGRPARLDPEDIFSRAANSWRAWAVEVRFDKGVPITSAVAWAADKATQDELFLSLLSVGPITRREMMSFRDRGFVPGGADDPPRSIERWVKSQVGVA